MGSNGSRVIKINNIEQHFEMCESLGQKRCPIYGQLDCVHYKGMDFNIAESITCEHPHPRSIHYLVQPNYLIFPDFTLLEDLCPKSLPHLLEIIQGICEMAVEGQQQGKHVGIGHNRIAFNSRWGVVGQRPQNWAFQQVWEEGITEGVFFSPQQMIALSQNRGNPVYNLEKADVFALAMILVEIIFQQDLAEIYDFENYEMRLNPLLDKLKLIKENFGEEVASLFIGMLEIQEEDRFDFQQALQAVNQILAPPPSRPSLTMLNSNNSQRNLQLSRGNRPGPSGGYNRTPKNSERGLYRNDVSPFRGRFGGNVKSNVTGPSGARKTPERAHESRSPMRRQNGARENFTSRQDFQSMQRVSPLGRR